MDFLQALKKTVESIKAWADENKVDKNNYDNDAIVIDNRIKYLENQLYKKITLSFSAGTAEFGQVVTSTVLSWSTNKTPTSLSLSGTNLNGAITDNTLTKYTVSNLSATSTSNETWTLSVTDERGATVSQEKRITFLHGVYYGVAEAQSSYDRNFILSLENKKLSGAKLSSFSVTAKDGKYIYYCLPSSMGDCIFNYNNFDGGFNKVKSEMLFENSHGYIEPYDIWMSDNMDLGSITIKVS